MDDTTMMRSGFQPRIDSVAAIATGASPGASIPEITKSPVTFVAECDLPTKHYGHFRLRGYRNGGAEPTVIVRGDVTGEDVLVRVHDQVIAYAR